MLKNMQVRRFSVEEMLDMGIGDRSIPRAWVPSIIANMARQRFVRRGRRGTVGNITDVTGATQGGLIQTWGATRGTSTGIPAAFTVSNPNGTTTSRQTVNYTYGSSGATAINQIVQTTGTIGTSATVNFNMVTWADNVIGDASATLTAVKEWWWELLTVAQGGGATASDVTLGDHATNAWAPILGATGTYAIKAGGMWHHQDQSSAGLAVTAGDLLKSVNNDASNIATYRVTAFGYK